MTTRVVSSRANFPVVRRVDRMVCQPGRVARRHDAARVGDDAGRSRSRVRRLATIEVAAYLQVPVKTLYAWRYEGKVLARIELVAIADTVGKM